MPTQYSMLSYDPVHISKICSDMLESLQIDIFFIQEAFQNSAVSDIFLKSNKIKEPSVPIYPIRMIKQHIHQPEEPWGTQLGSLYDKNKTEHTFHSYAVGKGWISSNTKDAGKC